MTGPGSATDRGTRRKLTVTVSVVLLAGIFWWLWQSSALSPLLKDLGQLSFRTTALVLAALIANVLIAAWRLKVASAQTGHPLRFREAAGALAVGSIGGALFFQLAGQLAARGAFFGRLRVPFESVVVITLYERVVAALLSFALALGGAYFIFGRFGLDRHAGGSELIKLIVGLTSAFCAGAALVYGRPVLQKIAPTMRAAPIAFAKMLLLSLFVQIPMLAAYVLAVRGMAGELPLPSLVAASSLVVFAASIPISFAGWGVREMSAIAAMGAIGVSAHDSFAAAVLVGAGSLLATALIAGLVVPIALHGAAKRPEAAHVAKTAIGLDYGAILNWAFPVAAATLVFFQLYIPVTSGTLLNVNLADPVALLCGALFCIQLVRRHYSLHAPRLVRAAGSHWRFPKIAIATALATVALAISLLHGAAIFGFTQWAVVNRFFGWFVLLSYAVSGAMIVRAAELKGLRVLLATFGAVAAALACLELVLLCISVFFDVSLPVNQYALEAFSQNHNFFAFQLLMAIPAVLVAIERRRVRLALLSILLAALYFSVSRSGWISAAAIIAAAILLRLPRAKDLLLALIVAAAGVLAFDAAALAFETLAGQTSVFKVTPGVIPTDTNTAERMITIWGGIDLFLHNPVFGAGLGAFRSKLILATSGIPLVIHSTYLWLLAELGISGFFVFVIPAVLILWSEIRRPVHDHASVVLILCIVGFAVMSIPADMMYQRTFWLVCGAALALPSRSGRQSARSSQPAG